jgi:hypothetical protein
VNRFLHTIVSTEFTHPARRHRVLPVLLFLGAFIALALAMIYVATHTPLPPDGTEGPHTRR